MHVNTKNKININIDTEITTGVIFPLRDYFSSVSMEALWNFVVVLKFFIHLKIVVKYT